MRHRAPKRRLFGRSASSSPPAAAEPSGSDGPGALGAPPALDGEPGSPSSTSTSTDAERPPPELIDDEPDDSYYAGGQAATAALRRRHRNRTILVLVCSVLVGAALPLLAYVGAITIFDASDGRVVRLDETETRTVLPNTDAAMLIGLDEAGGLREVTVVGLGPDGIGGHVLYVPGATVVQLESGALGPLSTAWSEGGEVVLRAQVERLLGMRFDASAVVDPQEWSQLLELTGPVTLELLDPVQGLDAAGAVVDVYPDGPLSLDPTDVGLFLSVQGVNESDLARLVRIQTFWQAWLQALSVQPDPPSPTTSVPDELADLPPLGEILERLAAGPVTFDVLPVEVIPIPGGGQVLRPREAEIRLLVARYYPGATIPVTPGPRVRVVNASGDPAVLADAAARLLFVGVNLLAVSDSVGEPATVTAIDVHTEDGDLSLGQDLAELLGAGTVAVLVDGPEGVDATIVLGADLIALVAAPDVPQPEVAPPADVADVPEEVPAD